MRATFSARRRDKLSAETREALSTEISRGLEFLKYESLEGMGRNWPILVTNKLGGAAVNRQSRAQPTEAMNVAMAGQDAVNPDEGNGGRREQLKLVAYDAEHVVVDDAASSSRGPPRVTSNAEIMDVEVLSIIATPTTLQSESILVEEDEIEEVFEIDADDAQVEDANMGKRTDRHRPHHDYGANVGLQLAPERRSHSCPPCEEDGIVDELDMQQLESRDDSVEEVDKSCDNLSVSSLRHYTFGKCLSSRQRTSSPMLRGELVRQVRLQKKEIARRDREIRRVESAWSREVSVLRQQIGMIALQKCASHSMLEDRPPSGSWVDSVPSLARDPNASPSIEADTSGAGRGREFTTCSMQNYEDNDASATTSSIKLKTKSADHEDRRSGNEEEFTSNTNTREVVYVLEDHMAAAGMGARDPEPALEENVVRPPSTSSEPLQEQEKQQDRDFFSGCREPPPYDFLADEYERKAKKLQERERELEAYFSVLREHEKRLRSLFPPPAGDAYSGASGSELLDVLSGVPTATPAVKADVLKIAAQIQKEKLNTSFAPMNSTDDGNQMKLQDEQGEPERTIKLPGLADLTPATVELHDKVKVGRIMKNAGEDHEERSPVPVAPAPSKTIDHLHPSGAPPSSVVETLSAFLSTNELRRFAGATPHPGHSKAAVTPKKVKDAQDVDGVGHHGHLNFLVDDVVRSRVPIPEKSPGAPSPEPEKGVGEPKSCNKAEPAGADRPDLVDRERDDNLLSVDVSPIESSKERTMTLLEEEDFPARRLFDHLARIPGAAGAPAGTMGGAGEKSRKLSSVPAPRPPRLPTQPAALPKVQFADAEAVEKSMQLRRREELVLAREEQVRDWECRLGRLQEELEHERGYLEQKRSDFERGVAEEKSQLLSSQQRLAEEIEEVEAYRAEFEALRTDLIAREAKLARKKQQAAASVSVGSQQHATTQRGLPLPAAATTCRSGGTAGTCGAERQGNLSQRVLGAASAKKVVASSPYLNTSKSKRDLKASPPASSHPYGSTLATTCPSTTKKITAKMTSHQRRDGGSAQQGRHSQSQPNQLTQHQHSAPRNLQDHFRGSSKPGTKAGDASVSVIATADLERLDEKVRRCAAEMLRSESDADGKMQGLSEENARLRSEIQCLMSELHRRDNEPNKDDTHTSEQNQSKDKSNVQNGYDSTTSPAGAARQSLNLMKSMPPPNNNLMSSSNTSSLVLLADHGVKSTTARSLNDVCGTGAPTSSNNPKDTTSAANKPSKAPPEHYKIYSTSTCSKADRGDMEMDSHSLALQDIPAIRTSLQDDTLLHDGRGAGDTVDVGGETIFSGATSVGRVASGFSAGGPSSSGFSSGEGTRSRRTESTTPTSTAQREATGSCGGGNATLLNLLGTAQKYTATSSLFTVPPPVLMTTPLAIGRVGGTLV